MKKKHKKYKRYYNNLINTSTGATSVGIIVGISAAGTSFTVIGLPLGVSLGAISTASSGIGGALLLVSRKYKKRLLKCYKLLDKISSALGKFDILISESLHDGTVIDANEFSKLQDVYLQIMQDNKNIDMKMTVVTEENFQKTIIDEIKNLKKAIEGK